MERMGQYGAGEVIIDNRHPSDRIRMLEAEVSTLRGAYHRLRDLNTHLAMLAVIRDLERFEEGRA